MASLNSQHAAAAIPGSGWLRAALAVMAGTAISPGFARYTYPFVLPAMKEDILGSYGAAGLLGGVNLGSYVVFVILLTMKPLRASPTRQIKLGLVGTCSGLVVMTAAVDVWMLYLAMTIMGASGALIWIPTSGVIAMTAPAHRRGMAYGLMTSGLGVSVAAAGLLTSIVQDWRGDGAWREVWALVAVISIVVSAIVGFALSPVPGAASTRSRKLRELRDHVAVGRLCWSFGLYGIGFSIYASYLVAALLETGITNTEANSAYSLMGLTSIVSGLLLGKASDLWGRNHILCLGSLFAGTCSALTVVTSDLLLLYLLVGTFGLMTMGIGSVLGAYLSDELPAADVPTVFGAAILAFAVAQFIAPFIGGLLADLSGTFVATYFVGGAAAVLGGLVARKLPTA